MLRSIFARNLQFSLIRLAAFIFLAVPSFAGSIDLTEDVWRFHIGDVERAQEPSYDDSSWSRVSVPHTWNALDAQDGKPRTGDLRPSGYRRTAAWYRQIVDIPAEFEGERVFIRCEGATLYKDVYINGRLVGQHDGAFTAFCFEITDFVSPGESALVAIKVDNSQHREKSTLELDLEPGRKTLDVLPLRGDFNLYGGIYRDIEIFSKPALCISPLDYASSGVYVSTPEVLKDKAEIKVETVLSLAGATSEPAVLRARLLDDSGNVVAESERALTARDGAREMLRLSLDSPRLWQGVKDPYLYGLEVSLAAEGSAKSDVVRETIGIRELIYDPARGFILNGELLKLRGVNRHQDWQDLGWAIGKAHHERDFELIREMGATAVRLAHYPQDPYVLELCDRLGLIVFMEIPLVGWVSDSEVLLENSKQQLREMIRQYHNHASIPVWGLWNELMNGAPDSMPSPIPLVRALQAVAKSEDPTRPTVGSANDRSQDAPGLRAITDLITWNLYPGWYGDSVPADMGDWLVEKRQWDARETVGVSEYGAGASIYQHEDWSELKKPVARSPWHPEEYQAYFHERAYRAIERDEKVWGSFVWNMFDFAADHRDEGDRPGINDKGLVTHDRKVRKDAFFFYKASWTDHPVLHITSRRYTPRPAGKATIKVYSNLSDLNLTVNGVSVGPGRQDGVVFVWEDLALEPGTVQVGVSAMHDGDLKTDRIDWEVSPPVRYATLKFDDMRPEEGMDGVTPIEQRVYDLLMAQDIPHAWGVCRLYQSDNPSFFAWLKARDAEGIEIWHHGNKHDRVDGESWEFKNRSKSSQQENFAYTQNRLFEKTGIVLETFGAPYNRTDAKTAEVLNASGAIKTMYFAQGSPEFKGLQLNDRVNLESKTGVVASLEAFKESYAQQADAEIIVLQAHPVYWDAEQALPKLQAILDFLKGEGRVFITPKDYRRLKKEDGEA